MPPAKTIKKAVVTKKLSHWCPESTAVRASPPPTAPTGTPVAIYLLLALPLSACRGDAARDAALTACTTSPTVRLHYPYVHAWIRSAATSATAVRSLCTTSLCVDVCISCLALSLGTWELFCFRRTSAHCHSLSIVWSLKQRVGFG